MRTTDTSNQTQCRPAAVRLCPHPLWPAGVGHHELCHSATSIGHLYKLANYPVVIHVSVHPEKHPDFSVITAIRNAGWTFLQSQSVEEAQDMALTAHALAIRSGKGVLHFFSSAALSRGSPASREDVTVVQDVLNLDNVRRFQSTHIPGSSIYADDGRAALVSEQPEPVAKSSSLSGAAVAAAVAENPSSHVSEKSSQQSATSSPPPVSSATTIEPQVAIVSSDDIYKYATSIWAQLEKALGRRYSAFEWRGPSNAEGCLFIFGLDAGLFSGAIDDARGQKRDYAGLGVITPRLYRPWLGPRLLETIPRSVKRIAVLEQIGRKTTKWGPILLDVLSSVKSGPGSVQSIVGYQVGYVARETMDQALRGIYQNLTSEKPIQNLHVGTQEVPQEEETSYQLERPKLETAYSKILGQLFGDRLHVANALESDHAGISATISASPEFGFGSLLARRDRRTKFIAEAKEAAISGGFLTPAPGRWLTRWAAAADDPQKANEYAAEIISILNVEGSSPARRILANKDLLPKQSLWLIGSDAWAFDLGNSGVHHVLASGENINMLIIDSTPYSERAAADASRRKKDIGLYAMNFGNAYVASVAVYSSYTQVLQAMDEADKFNGPSIVLAYLPYFGEHDSPLTVLQETKNAVDLGYWPLYRWNPDNENKGEPNFSLDSERIKSELKEFLARDNRLTQLAKKEPVFAANLSQDYGTEVRAQQKTKAKEAYSRLVEGLFGAPLTILVDASDNGNGQSLAWVREEGHEG